MVVSNRIAALIVAAALSLITVVGALNAAHAASETGETCLSTQITAAGNRLLSR